MTSPVVHFEIGSTDTPSPSGIVQVERVAINPNYTYNPKLKQITVPADGNYTVTLDLHVSGDYTYSVVRN